MTSRPRSHALETASVRAFASLLPDDWPDQEVRPDYGVDLRVTLWSTDDPGLPAKHDGLEFGVQLKATDDESSQGLSVGVSWEHIEFWQQLGYPVLIVRYAAATEALYGMWVHERGRQLESKPRKQAWFRFDESHRLTRDVVAGAIPPKVAAFRAARTRSLRLPIRLRALGSMASPSQAILFNTEFDRLLGPGRVSVECGYPSELSVTLEPDELVVDLGGGLGVFVHLDIVDHKPEPVDVVFVTGLCLARSGAVDNAIECLRAAKHSGLTCQPAFLILVVALCVEAREWGLTVDVLEACGPTNPALDAVLSILCEHASLMDQPTRSRLEAVYDGLVKAASEPSEQAAARFTRARYLREQSLHIEALSDLDEALRLDPTLEDHGPFLFSRAGTLFLLEQFVESAHTYKRVVDLVPDDSFVRGLFHDAVLHAGQYKEVLDRLHALDVDEVTTHEHLIGMVAVEVIQRFEIEQQERDPDAAEKLLDFESGAILETVQHIAEHDALTAVSAGLQEAIQSGELPDPLRLIAAARLIDRSPEAWAAALVTAAESGINEVIQRAIVERAMQYCPGDFPAALVEFVSQLKIEPPAHNVDLDVLLSLVTADGGQEKRRQEFRSSWYGMIFRNSTLRH